ncbi:DUF4365 domain-containing protein [Coleofasciculus sp. FACHB-129]|uniref:WD40 domain-containing protein n=1 Tax=Cyanophyceae TaxID=3028117 RepID=UPI0016876AD3|nr:DUF4365 domain-containing protein [Coleofasciculus sp. FACHB-129]MBD1896562.1 DUF4365 domain-containing protein [Coleofasciculus sp. FACHB-129]
MSNKIVKETIPVGFTLRYPIEKQTGLITDMAWSPDGQMIAIVSSNDTIDICDTQRGKRIWKLEGRHSGNINSIAWSPDGMMLASGSSDTTVGIWNIKTGKFYRRLKGHSNWVWELKWSPDGQLLASRSNDSTIRLWNTKTGKLKHTLSALSLSIVWSPDGQILASAHGDTLLFWDSKTGEAIHRLEGEFGLVSSMALSSDKRNLALVSDTTVLLWDFTTGQPTAKLESHSNKVTCISFSCDGRLLASKSTDGTVRLWRCDTWEQVAVFHERTNHVGDSDIAFHPTAPIFATLSESQKIINVWNLDINILFNAALGFESVRYRNAKVVLVGDTGVGKSGLGTVLAGEEFKPTASTHGRHVWSLGDTPHKLKNCLEETREILLWDLAGQVEFRLIHQLSLDQTSVALVLFDGSSPTDPFKGVAFWNKALRQAKGSEHLVKYLVAARTDVSTLTVTDERMNTFALELGFQGAFRTSAFTGEGVKELLQQIENAIDWEKLPLTVSERLFKQMKDFIFNQKQNGHVLKTATDIMRQFRIMYPEASFNDDDFRAAIEGVESHDLVKTLSFGDYVLFQSELLDNYASAMARAAREQPDGLGCLEEQAAREGKFNFGSLERITENEERIILQSVVELFITKELAILDERKLVLPSQFNRELPEYPDVEGSTVTYQFEGALLNVYATLVVRLYYSEAFKKESLWKNAAIFLPYGLEGDVNRCGFILKELAEGTGQLTAFFGIDVPDATKILFLKYLHEHLRRRALNGSIKRERIYCCPNPKCQEEFVDRKAVKVRLERGLLTIGCNYCDTVIALSDLIEETFGKDDKFLTDVRQMDKQIDANLDNASKRIILEGEFMALVGKAGQIPRLIPNDDNGIDGEIEFRNHKGEASGEKIYVQLKSGNSYLKKRKKDGAYTFQIEKERHIEYWQSHRYDVYLIVRDSDEKLYWMNVTQYLKKMEDKKTRTIVFNREELTVNALRDLRGAKLAQAPKALKPATMRQEETAGNSAESTNKVDK